MRFKRIILILTVMGGLAAPVLAALATARTTSMDEAEYWAAQWKSGDKEARIRALRWFNDHFLRKGMPQSLVKEKLGRGEEVLVQWRWTKNEPMPDLHLRSFMEPETNTRLRIVYERIGGMEIVRSFRLCEEAVAGNPVP
jgi:hypothetical protein